MKRTRLLVAIIAPIEVVMAVLAWRDLAQRPDDQVPGAKRARRVFVSLNPGNALISWFFGRRRLSGSPAVIARLDHVEASG